MLEKWCSRCKSFKPVSQFQKNSQARDGLFAICRTCQAKADRERGLWDAIRTRGEGYTVVSLDEMIEREYRQQ